MRTVPVITVVVVAAAAAALAGTVAAVAPQSSAGEVQSSTVANLASVSNFETNTAIRKFIGDNKSKAANLGSDFETSILVSCFETLVLYY
jgi:hypothetical protein